MRILIIKTSSLGDVIHALPVLEYLRQAAPEAVIDWVVDEAFADLLTGNPLIRRLITVDMRRWKKTPFSLQTQAALIDVVRKLREDEYDLVIDLQGNIKSGLICWLARSKRKLGFARENLQEKLNGLFTTQKVPFAPDDRHAVQRYLRIVSAPFGLQPEGREWLADIATSSDDNACAASQISGQLSPVVLLHTGTTWQTKLWYDDGWLQLGKSLLQRYPNCLILFSWGDEQERERGKSLVGKLGTRTKLLEKLSLKQFAAVLKRCDLVVAGDTGPVHLAAAVGTPTVSYYRCTDGSRNGPFGRQHAIVQSPLSCTMCMKKECTRDEECRRSISVDAIMDAANTIMSQERNQKHVE